MTCEQVREHLLSICMMADCKYTAPITFSQSITEPEPLCSPCGEPESHKRSIHTTASPPPLSANLEHDENTTSPVLST